MLLRGANGVTHGPQVCTRGQLLLFDWKMKRKAVDLGTESDLITKFIVNLIIFLIIILTFFLDKQSINDLYFYYLFFN